MVKLLYYKVCTSLVLCAVHSVSFRPNPDLVRTIQRRHYCNSKYCISFQMEDLWPYGLF